MISYKSFSDSLSEAIPTKSAGMDTAVAQTAKSVLHIKTLKTQNSDELDFHSLSVWEIKAALEAAYNAGKQSK